MNSVFSEQILADKLSKLNSTQQCIETLSHWCIFHQSKAELVVITWDKQFHNSEIAQQVPLLYLANDILQNSKRKGNEFVGEFWKVLPAALKKMIEKGDDRGKNVVTRLVDIWEERRVFRSRAQSLKELMLGEEAPPPLELSRKRSHSVRIVKRDSRSIRTKLSIGGEAEKIVSAYHLVQSEFSNEDAEMSKCNSAVQRIRKLERDFELACSNVKDPRRKTLAKELEDDETLLKQCIEKLKLGEANRAALVTQLKEALHGQESELENVYTQIQVAQAQAEESSNMRKKLNDDKYISDPRPSIIESLSTDANTKPKKSAAAIAAEVADKLAASTSSQYIMSSVLSTFAAEEAKNAGLTSSSSASNSFPSLPVNPAGANSMPNLENPISVSDPNMYTAAQTYSTQNHPYQSVMQSQAPLSLTHYQYMPPAGGIIGQYGYGSIAPLPAGPLQQQPPLYMMNSMVPLTPQPLQMTQQQSLSVTPPQPPAPPSFRPLQPPGMVYYAHHHNH